MTRKQRFSNLTQITLLTVIFVLFSACSGRFVEIRVPVERQDAIRFKEYQKVYIGAFNIPETDQPFDPRESLKTFFKSELAGIIKKEVEILPAFEGDSDTSPPLEFPHSLVITGKLTLETKDRKIIQEKKDAEGKKKRGFVNVQLWEMSLMITMKERDSGKEVATFTFNQTLKDASPEKWRFNYKSLLDRLTEQFLSKVTQKVKFQERYLLLK